MPLISAWVAATGKFEVSLERLFYRLGRTAAERPKRVLGLTLLVVAICASGFAFLESESAGDKLWVPQDSDPMDDRDYVEANFEREPLESTLIYTAVGGGNVLTVANVQRMFEMNERILALSQQGQTFTTMCERRSNGACEINGLLRFWSANYTLYNATVSSQADLLRDVSVSSYPDGGLVVRTDVFGKVSVDGNGNVTTAEGIKVVYVMQGVAADDITSTVEGKWQELFLNEAAKGASGVNVFRAATRSLDDELAKSVTGDISLVAIEYTVMILFASAALGGKGGSRSLLATCGVMLVLLAVVSGYGIASYAGVPFTSLQQILPFILVGIGIDDMFVITAAFDRTSREDDIPERCGKALRRAGLSVTTTSLTDVLAFLLGSFSSIPALQYFCIYAAFSIFMDYCFQVTAFVSCMALDAQRQLDGRVDYAPWIKRESVRAKALAFTENDRSPLQRFMSDVYGPMLSKPAVKIAVLVAFAGLFAAGVYGVTQVDEDFDVIDLTPDSSYLRDFLNTDYDLFGKERNLRIGVYTNNYNYADKTTQQRLVALENAMLANKWIESNRIDSWFREYRAYYNRTAPYSASVDTDGYLTNTTLFFQGLREFLNDTSYVHFQDDVVLSSGGDSVLRARFFVFGVETETGTERVDSMVSVTNEAENTPLSPKPFAFSFAYVFVEQLRVMRTELLFNFLMALVGVAIVTSVSLRHPGAALLLIAVVAVIDVDLMGFIYYWGLDVNSITVINLVMAIGLVVDYSAHLVHVFMLYPASSTRDERMILALGEIGPSILLGGATTLIGVLPLLFAGSFIFRVFFRMFLGIIIFGQTHGLILVPVLLSFIGPSVADKIAEREPKKDVEMQSVSA